MKKRIRLNIKGKIFLPLLFCVPSWLSAIATTSSAHYETTDSLHVTNLKEVVVDGRGAFNDRMSAEMGHNVFDADRIVGMPVLFAEPDIVKTLQTLPGVSPGVEGFTGLLVRGGENDQNMFLFNGIPLYHVTHLGGIFSSFNVATVGKMDFYKGVFPARFGGRISSVVDIDTKTPDFTKYHGNLSVGLLNANVYVTGPIVKKRTAFSAAIRRTWLELISVPAIAIMNSIDKKNGKKHLAGYGFTDLNMRIDHKFSNALLLSVSGYYGYDHLKIGLRESEPTKYMGSYYESSSTLTEHPTQYFDDNSNRLGWGNYGALAGVKWVSGKGILTGNLFVSRYFSTYKQEHEYQADLDDLSTYGFDKSKQSNSITDLGINLAYIYHSSSIYGFTAGGGFIRHRYRPDDILNEYSTESIETSTSRLSAPIYASEGWLSIDNNFDFGSIAALTIGVRGGCYRIYEKNHLSIEPRTAIRVSVSEKASIKASYGRSSQFVQQLSSNYISLPTDLWLPFPKGQEPLKCNLYSLGVFFELPWSVYASAEGWYKDMCGLLEYKDGVEILDTRIPWEEKITNGKGWAYGADLIFTKYAGQLTGTFGYGLMWTWRKFDTLNGGEKFPGKFDNRHKVNINIEYELNEKIRFNAGWTYMTGNRLTMAVYNYRYPNEEYPDTPSYFPDNGLSETTGLNYLSSLNNIRIPAYHRLDIGMRLKHFYQNGNMGEWTFSLYNAYCHMNVLTIRKELYHEDPYHLDDDKNKWHRRFRALSLIPVIPSVSYTYNF